MLAAMHCAPDAAAPTLPRLPERVQRFVRHAVLHCTGTPNGVPLSRPEAPKSAAGLGETPTNVLDVWHGRLGYFRPAEMRNAYNWRLPHIGYHYVIDLDGTVWTGRHLEEPGMGGVPDASIDICLVGGGGDVGCDLADEAARFSAAQWDALGALLVALSTLLGLPLAAPVTRHERGVCGHRDKPVPAGLPQRPCPGFDVGAYLDRGLQPFATHLIPAAR